MASHATTIKPISLAPITCTQAVGLVGESYHPVVIDCPVKKTTWVNEHGKALKTYVEPGASEGRVYFHHIPGSLVQFQKNRNSEPAPLSSYQVDLPCTRKVCTSDGFQFQRIKGRDNKRKFSLLKSSKSRHHRDLLFETLGKHIFSFKKIPYTYEQRVVIKDEILQEDEPIEFARMEIVSRVKKSRSEQEQWDECARLGLLEKTEEWIPMETFKPKRTMAEIKLEKSENEALRLTNKVAAPLARTLKKIFCYEQQGGFTNFLSTTPELVSFLKEHRETLIEAAKRIKELDTENINDLAASLNGLDIQKLFEDFTFIVTRVKEMEICYEKAKSDFKKPQAIIRVLEIIITIFCAIYLMTTADSFSEGFAIFLMLTSALGLFSTLAGGLGQFKTYLEQLYTCAKKHFSPQQSASDIVTPLTGVLSTVMCLALASQDKSISPGIIKVGNVARALTNVNNFSDAISVAVDSSQRLVMSEIFGFDGKLDEIKEVFIEIIEWSKSLDLTIQNSTWLGNYQADSPRSKEILDEQFKLGKSLYERVMTLTPAEKGEFPHYITEQLRILRKYIDSLANVSLDKVDHQTPVWVYMAGGPGVGKTMTANILIPHVLSTLPEDVRKIYTVENIMYRWQLDSEFLDGYVSPTFGIFIDEIFQSKDDKALSDQAITLIQKINPIASTANMATLEKKDKLPFSAKMIVSTSNKIGVDNIKIQSPDALKRRRDFVVIPTVKRQFRIAPNKDMLDTQKWLDFCAQNNKNPTIPTFATYILHDPLTDVYSQTINYDTLVEKIRDKILGNTNSANNYRDEYKSTVQAALAGNLTYQQEGAFDVIGKYEAFKKRIQTHEIVTQVIPPEFLDLVYNEPSTEMINEWENLSGKEQNQIFYATCSLGTVGPSHLDYLLESDFISKHKDKFVHKVDIANLLAFQKTNKLQLKVPLIQRIKQKCHNLLRSETFHICAVVFGIFSAVATVVTLACSFTQSNPIRYIKNKVESYNTSNVGKIGKSKLPHRIAPNQESGLENIPLHHHTQQTTSHLVTLDVERTENGWDYSPEKVEVAYDQQAVGDKSLEENLPIILRNTASVEVMDDNSGSRVDRARALIVANGYALMPKHLILRMNDSRHLKIKGMRSQCTLKQTDYIVEEIGPRWEYNDAVLVIAKTSKDILGANIVDKFLTVDQIINFNDSYGEVITNRDGTVVRCASQLLPQEKFVKCLNSNRSDHLISREQGLYAVVGVRYIASTEKGDCGSPIIRYDKSSKEKIVGIHCAGALSNNCKYEGFGCFVDQDWIKMIIAKYGYQQQGLADLKDVSENYGKNHLLKESMYVYGKVPAGEFDKIIEGKSKIVPSPLAVDLQDLGYKVYTKPTEVSLAKGKSVDKVLEKFKLESVYVDRDLLSKLENAFYLKYIFGKMKKHNARVLTPLEAINKFENLDHVNLSSSPGLPFICNKSTSDKVKLIERLDDGFCFKDPFLESRIFNEVRDMKIGIHPPWTWLNRFKDERLPIEKVDNHKIRLYTVPPFSLSIITRMYYGSFISALRDNKFDHGMMIGIAPETLDWHILASTLKSYSNVFLAADYSNFDRTIPKPFLKSFFNIHAKFREHYQIDSTEYEILKNELTCPIMQLDAFRYAIGSANPSGSSLTTEINCFANKLIIWYCLIKSGMSFESAINDTYTAVYGDDNIIASRVPFDINKFLQAVKDIGMTMTSFKKDDECSMLPLEQIKFLQRSFSSYNGIYVGQLPIEIIMESLMWENKSVKTQSVMEDTVRNAITQLELYPADEVSREYESILLVCSKNNVKYDITEHMLRALNSTRQEGKFSNTLCLKFAKAFLPYFSPSSIIVRTPQDLANVICPTTIIKKQLIIKDAADYLPIPKLCLFHTGIKLTSTLGVFELTFSSAGVVIHKLKYNPTYLVDVNVDFYAVKDFIDSEYHYLSNNCHLFCFSLTHTNSDMSYKLLGTSLYDLLTKTFHDFVKHETLTNYQQQSDVEPKEESKLEINLQDVTPELICPSLEAVDPIVYKNACSTRTYTDYLQTEVNIATLSVDDSTVFGKPFAKFTFPDALLKDKQYATKLVYNTLYTADISLRIRVNSTRFQYGSFLAVWLPMGTLGFVQNIELDPFAYTAMPHCFISISEKDSKGMLEKKLCIPFVHIQNYLKLANGGNNARMGELRLYIINKIHTVNSESFKILITGNFENLQAHTPTSMGLANTTLQVRGNSYPKYFFESGEDDEADKKVEKGLVSGPTKMIADAASLFSNIPIFKGAAAGVSAVANSISSISQYFGFSKPISSEVTHPYIPRPFTSVSMHDGLDMSLVMGTSVKNSVKIQPSIFGTLADELNIAYICRTPQIVAQFDWKDENSGSTLFEFPVVPTFCQGTPVKNLAGSDAVQLAPVGYVSLAAEWWRGSLNFRFKAISSEFHSGVLVFVFTPLGFSSKDEIPDLATCTHVKLDLSQMSDNSGEMRSVEFAIPFISDQYVHKVPDPFEPINLNSGTAVGTIQCYVLNSLVATNVDREVQINIEMWAGHDFQLAVPTLSKISNYNFGAEFFPPPEVAFDMELAEAMGEMQSKDKHNARFYKVNSLPLYSEKQVNTFTQVIGEELYNLRDFMKIFTQKFDPVKTTIKAGSSSAFRVPLHSFIPNSYLSTHVQNITFTDYFLRMFRFYKGSIRYKFAFNTQDMLVSSILDLDSISTPYQWLSIESLPDAPREGSPWGTTHLKLNPTLEVSVPYYHDRKSLLVAEEHNRSIILKATNYNSGNRDLTVSGFEAIGDDMSAGYMTGPPRIYRKLVASPDLFARLERAYDVAADITKLDGYYKPDFSRLSAVEPDIAIITRRNSTSGVLNTFLGSQKIYYTSNAPKEKLVVLKLPNSRFGSGTWIKENLLELTRFSEHESSNFFYVFIYLPVGLFADQGSVSFSYGSFLNSDYKFLWYVMFQDNSDAVVATFKPGKFISPGFSNFSFKVVEDPLFWKEFVTLMNKNLEFKQKVKLNIDF
ncbi:hypothetical protein [Wenzhou picorna-like virus 36]|uniref:hypothetical protein n=1 Tax=Wenzhou picorna-like virus 36 TaxID=1923622 RepID=UPI0009099617|nr:hypothetical protein [Wenzhou picorna-like virus 36]APG78526.1 hypothetical protein [Wenzhou picorna-like virus 36]